MSESKERGELVDGQGLVVGAYLACGGIAVGSVGPWGADVFGYSGIGNNGSLTLLAAGLAAFAVWRWTTSLRKSAAIATLTAGALCAAVAVHDMLDIRDVFGGSNVLVWIEGVGWGLGLVFLSGVALALLSLPLLRRGRAAKRPGFNWKQSALLAGIAAMFLVGLSSVASSEPDRAGSESLFLEGPGSQRDAGDAEEEILALRPGTSAESVMERLGPPVSMHLLEEGESTFYYDTWQLTFTGDGLRDRIRHPPGGPRLSFWAFEREERVYDRKIRQLQSGTSIKAVKARLGRPEAVEVYGSSLQRDVGLWYGEWRLDFDGRELKGRYR
jgi:hypothetical protein